MAAEDILGDHIARGVVLDVKKCPEVKYLQTFCGTHPLPSDENLAATEAIVATLKDLTERDLVIFVISGGGSTLLFLPQNRNDREEISIFNALTDAGATIEEMNTVRKHLSLARGGWLAEYAYPAQVISLIFSDVPGRRHFFRFFRADREGRDDHRGCGSVSSQSSTCFARARSKSATLSKRRKTKNISRA